MTSDPPALRVIGRSEFLPEPVRTRARADLPFPIEFELCDTIDGLQRVVCRPESFDVYHQWHTVDLMWTARCIQAIALDRIEGGDAIRTAARARIGDTAVIDTVFDRLFLQPDGTLGPRPSAHLSMLPALHGVDSFVIRAGIKGLDPHEPHSWGWLFDERFKGRAALVADPVLGMIEAALATEAAERVSFGDIGNLSIDEIDLVADTLIRLKRLGHFRRGWRNYEEAADLMRRGVQIQSMFYPGFVRLQRSGFSALMSDPVEGMRGWHADLCISSGTQGEMLDAAYAYLNWWQGGWPVACLSRQGYYGTFPDRVRDNLSDAEWDYWYGGAPASEVLCDPFGQPAVSEGHRRAGGSHRERMSRARVWNTFMDEHTYLMRRWQEFVAP